MKNKNIGCLVVLLCSPYVAALEPIDDNSLATVTGQDGLSIKINTNQIQFKSAALIDKDGFSTTAVPNYSGKSAFVLAGQSQTATTGIQLLANQSSAAAPQIASNGQIQILADTDGGNASTGSFANLAIGLSSDIQRIRILPFSVYVADYSGTDTGLFTSGSTLRSGVGELIRIGNNGIDFNFQANNSPKMNIQLGGAPQGHLVKFSGALQSICTNNCVMDGTNPITIVSGNTGTKFGFKFEGTNAATGFVLDGFYAGVEPSGLVLGNDGESSKFNTSLNNVLLGDTGAANTDTFNNLTNSSIGTFGVVGASVTNMKIKVSGL
ncbi:DUF6160 family protein [Acinetobacter guerrae]|uniref:DUF6160 family protein n=1 Tax=Acinetobacter guerrae TaxID=1843371 RepID=UPI00125F6D23|nr:DUF6160 family protein [Acinetobacter guerrae]